MGAEVVSMVNDLSERMARVEERLTNVFKRLDQQEKLLESVQDISLGVRSLTLEMKQNNEKIDALSHDVDELRQKPAKRWETVVAAVISALVGAFVAYMISKGA